MIDRPGQAEVGGRQKDATVTRSLGIWVRYLVIDANYRQAYPFSTHDIYLKSYHNFEDNFEREVCNSSHVMSGYKNRRYIYIYIYIYMKLRIQVQENQTGISV